ncbi:hypothetical protein [Delftia lacustris]
MPQLFLNNFQTQFIADVRAAPQTGAPASELDYGVLRVSDGAAGLLRTPEPGSWYVLTAYKRSGSLESDYEVLHITAVDNSVIGECRLTVLRGQEGTAPRAYVAGDLLELRLTAGGMGVKVDREDGKGLSANDFTNAEKAKLDGIAAQATRNATDAQLRDRTTHTGAQAISTITGLQAALDARAPKENPTFTGTVSGISKSMVGLPNVDNTADVDKPVSTAQQTALAGKVDKVAGKGLSAEDFTAEHRAKLDGVAPQATKNATDAQLRDRSTHTGEQEIASITGLQAALNNALKKTGDTMAGTLNFSGNGLRLTADFSNSIPTNRLAFQTNAANEQTALEVIPSGTAGEAAINLASSATDQSNCAVLQMRIGANTGDTRIAAERRGTGTYYPMTFYTGGAERMRIDAAGNVGIGGSPLVKLTVANAEIAGGPPASSGSAADPNAVARLQAASSVLDFGVYGSGEPWLQSRRATDYAANHTLRINPNGGSVLFGPGSFGYASGTGAGGTVTQSGSKTSAVTLNKPTGQITMSNAALGAGGSVVFVVNNSFVLAADLILFTCPYLTVNPTNYRVEAAYSSNGAFAVRVTNVSGSTLGEALVIQFTTIKGGFS